MVTVVKGNLLEAKENIIAHQVNCQKKMNSGVAKAIREKWSKVFEYYQRTEPQLGNVGFVEVVYGRQYVANMYSQDKYGYDGKQYTDYEAFRKCCKNIVENLESKKYTVAMPYKIASDRGGADWDKIMDILLEEFTDVDLTLYKL
jgi:O-acetyl-ADP-ribose deacetylase (regulator of RNase III)